MYKNIVKPIYRGKFRRWVGKKLYITIRYYNWFLTAKRFSKKKNSNLLPYSVISHSSPLLRQLKDVEMIYQHNKIRNLELAVARLNKIIIYPGETFSFWVLVGNPTQSKGYLTGLVLDQGKISYGVGGGLCQLSNLLYWMVLHSPLVVKERWRHSYDVFPDNGRKLPFGSGATVSFNYIDFQFENQSSQPYQLHIWLTEKELHGEIRCNHVPQLKYEVYESNHSFNHESWGGYSRHNEIRRKTVNINTNEILLDERVTENHALIMYSPFLR